MVLAAHSDVGFHNESKGRSQVGSHILLAKNAPVSRWNGPILTIPQAIKFVMSSASEAELGAIFFTSKELVTILQTLIDMGWPQPHTPIQTDNSMASGMTNETIIAQKIKSMDLRLN